MTCPGGKRPSRPQKNIENFSNDISKGSKSMFARQFDYVPLHCKQSCKTRFENDENLGINCPEMEFKEFKPRFKSDKTRFKLSPGLNL